MKQYIFLIFISSLLLFSLTFGCSSSHPKKTHDHRDVSVELREKLDEKGNVIKKSFNHPYYFTGAGLAYMLSSVYYKGGGYITGKREKMVFQEEELQNIIPPIISAFSMANDSQDILVFSSPHYDFWVNTRSYFSMFITNNELNIVFSTIKSKKSWRTDGRALQMSTYWRNSNKRIFKDPLDVKRSSRWRLVPMEGQRFAPGRPNWLIIDLSSNLFGMAGSDNVSDNISDNSIEAGSSVRAIERKVRTNENVIEDKLRKLKVQKDEGLISKEDYEKRKKELLGKF
ncbi:MAG: SHOCT domain-containing protein [Candidatus Scalindua sediminis]|nr:SHOCT domain-containing protein [Candidatus Scalindua sediminis]HDY69126.1 SHOCT domain-containing protein [Candidatus Scalindua sp.]